MLLSTLWEFTRSNLDTDAGKGGTMKEVGDENTLENDEIAL